MRVGLHEILALTGKSGMGEVTRVPDTRFNRDAAMKYFAFGSMRTAKRQGIYQILNTPCRIKSVILVLVIGMMANAIVVAQRARQVDDATLKVGSKTGDEWISYNGQSSGTVRSTKSMRRT